VAFNEASLNYKRTPLVTHTNIFLLPFSLTSLAPPPALSLPPMRHAGVVRRWPRGRGYSRCEARCAAQTATPPVGTSRAALGSWPRLPLGLATPPLGHRPSSGADELGREKEELGRPVELAVVDALAGTGRRQKDERCRCGCGPAARDDDRWELGAVGCRPMELRQPPELLPLTPLGQGPLLHVRGAVDLAHRTRLSPQGIAELARGKRGSRAAPATGGAHRSPQTSCAVGVAHRRCLQRNRGPPPPGR
jgi:hypothetical protein